MLLFWPQNHSSAAITPQNIRAPTAQSLSQSFHFHSSPRIIFFRCAAIPCYNFPDKFTKFSFLPSFFSLSLHFICLPAHQWAPWTLDCSTFYFFSTHDSFPIQICFSFDATLIYTHFHLLFCILEFHFFCLSWTCVLCLHLRRRHCLAVNSVIFLQFTGVMCMCWCTCIFIRIYDIWLLYAVQPCPLFAGGI